MDWLKKLYHSYKKKAADRGYYFFLSISEFLELVTDNNCAYCGRNPYQYTYGNPVLGIDRVDNELGYDVDNCVPCCKDCNYKKRNKSLLQFLFTWQE